MTPSQRSNFREPETWGRLLSELMDVFVFGALFLTTEVQAWPFFFGIALMLFRLLTKFRFRTFSMVCGYLFLLSLGVFLTIRNEIQPIVAAAHVLPIALAWVSLAQGGEKLWGWRLALGFMGLILASALSPDFIVTILSVFFIVCGTIALPCRFLAAEFARRGVSGALPRGFIRSSFRQSGILFLAALFIFPLIPRVQGRGGGSGNDQAQTGYTEEVSLNEWSRVSSRGASAAALRIYGPEGVDPSDLVPSGLLRSRVLNVLHGNTWEAAKIQLDTSFNRKRSDKSLPVITIVREMTGTPSLAVPYGAKKVGIELSGYRWNADKTKLGEYQESRSRNQRFHYTVAVDVNDVLKPQDPPSATELEVPDVFRTPQIEALAARLFKGAKNGATKLRAVQDFYRTENFKAKYLGDEAALPETDELRKMPPLERFLFVEKAGHCELFASGMAVLLRMSGIPTRLLAGFRVSRNTFGDILTVRQSDAHAWVEAYLSEEGWTVVDPTPRLLRSFALTDFLRDSYDWAGAKWSQYIINYGDTETTLGTKWRSAKRFAADVLKGKNPLNSTESETELYLFVALFLASGLLLSSLGVILIRTIRKRSKPDTVDPFTCALMRERGKFEKMRPRLEVSLVTKWSHEYERLRFGKRDPNVVKDFQQLREMTRESRLSLSSVDDRRGHDRRPD